MTYYVLWFYSNPSKSTDHRELDPSFEFNEWFSSFSVDFESYRLDSELIPRLLENFENWKNFMVILLSVKNDAYRRFFGA